MKNKAPYIRDIGINFPPFDTIVLDPELEKFFGYGPLKEIGITDYAVVVEKYMPLHSALFLRDKKIVAIYHKGSLVFDEGKLINLTILFAEFMKGKMK